MSLIRFRRFFAILLIPVFAAGCSTSGIEADVVEPGARAAKERSESVPRAQDLQKLQQDRQRCLDEKRRLEASQRESQRRLEEQQRKTDEVQKKLDGVLAIDREVRGQGRRR